MKLGDKLIILIVGIVFFGIGVVLVLYSGAYKKNEKNFNENAEPVSVYVNNVDVDIHRKSTGKHRRTRTTYTAYVTYEIDGKTYSNIKISDGDGAEHLKEGTNVMIYYHKDDPTWLRVEKNDDSARGGALKIFGFVFCGFGLLAVFGAFFGKPANSQTYSTMQNSKMIKNGKRYEGEVINIREEIDDNNYSRKGYLVECKIFDNLSGSYIRCQSKKVYEDLGSYDIKTVPVYVNPKDFTDYYVDVYEAIDRAKNSQINNVVDYR